VLTTAISVLRPAPPPPRMREEREPAGARFGVRLVVRVRWASARPGRRPRSYQEDMGAAEDDVWRRSKAA
jgi:hypothetical protein